ALRDAGATAERLHEHWATRSPVVVDLRVAREILSEPERDDRPPYELTPAFEFARERCYFLVRANNYDARDGTPRWGAAAEARRLGARAGDVADVLLPDGTPAWCDGGPRTFGVLSGVSDSGEVIVHRFALEAGLLR